jgi:hypothetical protein
VLVQLSEREAQTMSKVFTVKGSTTDVTDCELCGRTDLKGTIVLSALDADGNDTGEIVYYGADCGARAAKWTVRQIRTAAKTADDARRNADNRARVAEQMTAHRAWSAWLTNQTGKTEISEAIQVLGGFASARALHRQQAV